MSAHPFAKLHWRGRDGVFVRFLAPLMIPQEILVVPMFLLMRCNCRGRPGGCGTRSSSTMPRGVSVQSVAEGRAPDTTRMSAPPAGTLTLQLPVQRPEMAVPVIELFLTRS
jgi:hypothetical protein